MLCVGGMISCSDWLDVKSKAQLVEKDMFSNYEGNRNALNGVYQILSHENLYGRELSWGFLSMLGQNYKSDFMHIKYVSAAEGNYARSEVKDVADGIWAKAYYAIANCNNLIANTVDRDPSFFPEGEVEKDLILGEARGLRALMHFDLLRLFAPAPLVADQATYIPYVTEYPTTLPRALSVNETLDSIIMDLEFAKKSLAYNDTLYNRYVMETVESRIEDARIPEHGGLFFYYRGTRMNYVAACGLLARVYLYKGDKVNALRHARDAYKFDHMYNFTSVTFLNRASGERSRKLYDDLLLAFSNNKEYELVKAEVRGNEFKFKNLQELYVDSDDYRLLYLTDSTNHPFRWMEPTFITSAAENVMKYQGPLLPIIRKSEVYYIMCECLADTDLEEAMVLLEKARSGRGCKAAIPRTWDKKEFLDFLYMEATREFLSEGQTFYLYKRLNLPIFNGKTPLDLTGKNVLPLPDGEVIYY